MTDLKLVIIIFCLILSPCILGLIPDRKPRQRKQRRAAPAEAVQTIPEPEPTVCDPGKVQEDITEDLEQLEEIPYYDEIEQQQLAMIAEYEADIEAAKSRLGKLFALLDIATANQLAANPGSSADVKYQKQILTYDNQISAAEKRLRSAQFKKQTAERRLYAA